MGSKQSSHEHPTEFTVRCSCGNVFNTNDAFVGRALRCRCGEMLVIERPSGDAASGARRDGPHASHASHASHRSPDDSNHARGTQHQRRRRSSSTPLAPTSGAGANWRIGGGVAAAFTAAVGRIARPFLDALHDTRSIRLTTRWTARAAWAYAGAILVAWGLLRFGSERVLLGTVLAYGPRFLLLIPLVVIVPAALIFARRTVALLVVAGLVTIGPIMGGRVSLHTLGRGVPAAPGANTMRVISFNALGGASLSERLDELQAMRPDAVAIQECGPVLRGALEKFAAAQRWSLSVHHSLCTMTRWPIVAIDSMPRNDLARLARYGFGGSARVVRHTVATPRGAVILVNVHLETPRKGLNGFLSAPRVVESGAGVRVADTTAPDARLEINTRIRELESERASLYAVRGDKSVPVIVAGDFNLPVESTIYRQHWSGYTDAFEVAGTGFGWSKREGTLLRVRIDHILGNRTAPRPVGAWVGPDWGSDHRPVIADLGWR